jgi:hypothetical protein
MNGKLGCEIERGKILVVLIVQGKDYLSQTHSKPYIQKLPRNGIKKRMEN